MNNGMKVGIRGWLLLFAITMIIRPFFAALTIIHGLVIFSGFPQTRIFIGLYVGSAVPMTLYCCYAAFLLWKRDSAAPRFTARYLWVFLAYSVLFGAASFVLGSGESPQVAAFVQGLRIQGLASIGYVLIWARYLAVSVRVANTFSPNQRPNPPLNLTGANGAPAG